MKKFLLLLLLSVSLLGQSQVYNNEWIDYSKTYYKFKVPVTGIYRISHAVLTTLGIQNTPAEHYQLWRNGHEVPLFTTTPAGALTASDYIEFWGEMNDGKPDLELYRLPEYQLNDKWSMETDTAAFFLTINPAGNNKRLSTASFSLPTAIPAEPYFIHTQGHYYKEKYNQGYAAVVGEYIYSSSFDQGEGFTSNDITTFASRTGPTTYNVTYGTGPSVIFNNLFVSPAGPNPRIKIGVSGNSLNVRRYKMTMNGDSVIGDVCDFFDHSLDSTEIPLASISSNSADFKVTNLATVGCPDIIPGEPIQPCAVDRMVVHKIELKYPRLFNFGGANNFRFELPANPAGNYLEISGFNHSGTPPVLIDFTNGRRYVADISNPSLVRVVLEPSATARRLLLVTQVASYPIAVTSFQQRNFVNYSLPANQGNYLIISHPAMMTASGGSNPVEDYRVYRSSTTGGSHIAKVYQIDELIDQYGFGIKMNPNAVRNFIRWARNTYSSTPVKNVLLIGKGLNYIHNHFFQNTPDIAKLSFIPSWGIPASDNLLAADPGMDERPRVPIGRLSVINGNEVAAYLNKVKQYEQQQAFSSPLIADKAWMKNIIHAIGAGDVELQKTLDIYMNKYKSIISDTFYGANVHTFSKTSTDAVEQSSNQRLQNLFQEGLGIVTYFGHSSATTLEYNLDNPFNYNNQSKYPLFLLLGCNAGNFFNYNPARLQTKETISEKYVLAEERGGIASFASTHLGIVHYLDIYNTRTYNAMSKTKYGQTFGEIMTEAINQTFALTSQNDFYARLQCEQTTLHGDPAIKMIAFPKPDYVIEDQLVKVSPAFVSVAETSFKINASFMNIGKAINKDIVVEVKRTYPNQVTEVIRRDTIPGIRFIDSLTYNIPIIATRDKGANKITITVDADNVVDELYETNNSITRDVVIFEEEARPIYPYNLSIVNQQNIRLFASTANPFALSRQYNMEMDTTELFNSSLKVTKTVTSSGGLIEFVPGMPFVDSTVYYWRVSPAVTTESPVWNSASFIYLPASEPGFNQSHYFQQTRSDKDQMTLNPQSRNWNFDSVNHFIFAKNGVFLTATTQEGDLIVSPDGIAYIRSACVGFSVIFNIFNPRTFAATENLTGLYGSYGPPCDVSRQWNFEYSYMTAASRKLAMDFMDQIPDGYIVVVRNILNNGQTTGFINDWKADEALYGAGNTLYHKLKAVGHSTIDSFTSPRAFIHIYRKGDPGFEPKSVITDSIFDLVSLTKDVRTPDSVGYITSPAFGRAKGWKQLKWRGKSDPVDVATPGDNPTVDVIGVDNAGVEVTLLTGLTTSQQDHDISSINAAQFPFIKLKMRNADSVNYTPYQMKFWLVTYDPVPEGAIAPNLFLKTKDTVDIGEPIDFKVAFKNVTPVAFDSLRLKVVITNSNNVPHIIPLAKRRPLTAYGTPNDTLQIGALVNTANFPGANTLYLEANPDNDQPEQHHFNNFAFRNLFVRPDSLSPLLDVTFDGVHILNRDIVSSKPDIIVRLKDEAKWMILDDTSLLKLHVKFPNGVTRRFYFNNDTLQFIPAGQAPNPDNTATINFRPYFTEDGEYEMIVSGKDRSDNAAGDIEYRVIFEVINKPMISNMLNYPNPFTTSTAFVFTITGSEVPQNIKIEIMTITGKIVREITRDELGALRIGRNITEFKWDGTDQFGQKLANGIYLYRVVTNLNGKSLDKYKADGDKTDKYFNKGYGKMYLMR